MSKIFIKSILAIIILFAATGCSRTINKYHVNIDAISNTGSTIAPSSYSIKPLGKETDPNGLLFQRQSKELTQMLNELGYTPSGHENLAMQIIYFDYGIEKIKDETVTYQEPSVSVGMSWGYPYGYRHRYYDPFWNDIRYTSYRTYQKNYKLFNRYIVILSKDQTGKELWRIDASSVGESENLRKIIPLLINASKPYIGSNRDEVIKLSIAEDENKTE